MRCMKPLPCAGLTKYTKNPVRNTRMPLTTIATGIARIRRHGHRLLEHDRADQDAHAQERSEGPQPAARLRDE